MQDDILEDQACAPNEYDPTIEDNYLAMEFKPSALNEYDPTIEDYDGEEYLCYGSSSQNRKDLEQFKEIILRDSIDELRDRCENLSMLMERSCEMTMSVSGSMFASGGQERFRSITTALSDQERIMNAHISLAPTPSKEEGQDEFWGFTEMDRMKREFVKELSEFSKDADSEGESVWYNNMLVSTKFDPFCEILAKFPDRKMLKITKQKRSKIYRGVRKIFEIFSLELKLNNSGENPYNMWKQSILQIICRSDVQLLADDILEGDLIYKVASESLLKNGLNSLGSVVSGEVLSYVKFICCFLRCVMAVAGSDKDGDEAGCQFIQSMTDEITDWIWPDFVLDNLISDGISRSHMEYRMGEVVSQIYNFTILKLEFYNFTNIIYNYLYFTIALFTF